MLKIFDNFNFEKITKKMKVCVAFSVVFITFLLFQLCTNSNYRASVRFLKENSNINPACGNIKSVNMNLANTKKGKYIFNVIWQYGCKHEVFIQTDLKTDKVIKYKFITEDSDRCFYYGQVSEKYKCR